MKSVFITGATTGIGEALAKYYLAQGWQVGICGRDPDKFTEHFVDNQFLYFYCADVSRRSEIIEAVDQFVNQVGSLDLMIANAGIGFAKKTKLPDFETSQKMIEINTLGTLYSFEAAIKHMEPKGSGHLVAIASVAGYVGLPGVAAYSASKAAVIKLCESLSLDLKKFGIHITCINPGFIDTPLTRKNKHPMPFLMKAEQGALLIARAIECKKSIYTFPWQMHWLMRFLEILPRCWYRKIFNIKIFNFSRG